MFFNCLVGFFAEGGDGKFRQVLPGERCRPRDARFNIGGEPKIHPARAFVIFAARFRFFFNLPGCHSKSFKYVADCHSDYDTLFEDLSSVFVN